MTREQMRAAWFIGTLMVLELLAIWSLAYFARLPHFFFIFLRCLRILSPLFLWIYAVIFLLVMFGKGKEFTWVYWKDYLLETLRFFVLSLFISLAILVISAFLGVVIWFVLKRLNALPAVNSLLDTIRQWIAVQFY